MPLTSTSPQVLRLFLSLLLALGAFWVARPPLPAEASHFRAAQINWIPAGGSSIQFTVTDSFRRDGYECIDTATFGTKPCAGGDGFPGVGDVVAEFIGFTQFNLGDGSPPLGSPFGPLMYLVTSVEPDSNTFSGTALDPASLPAVSTAITHTYPSVGNFTAFVESCCRISSLQAPNAHINNPDGSYRVETTVNVGTSNSSPVSSLPAIVLCPTNGLCAFQVPGSDPNGDHLQFRLATSAEAGGPFGFFTQPGPPFAPNAASISSSGQYSWNTTGAALGPDGFNTLYSTQIVVEDMSAGDVKSKTSVDFFIQLVPSIGQPPQFTAPTPPCGSTLTASAGTNLTFGVRSVDPDAGDTVTLNVAALPAGATLSPGLPTTGSPVSSAFAWTPGLTQAGTHVLTFSATDGSLQQALCAVTVNVSAGDTIAPTTTATLSPAPNANGWNNTNTTVSLTATDNPGGSGVKSLTYAASGAVTFASTTVNAASASLAVATNGVTTLPFGATDVAGNAETPKTFVVKVDKVKPTCSLSVDTDVSTGTYIQTNFTIRDSRSGLASIEPVVLDNARLLRPISFTVGTTASMRVSTTRIVNSQPDNVTLRITDQAGNVTLCDPVSVSVSRAAGKPVSQTFPLFPGEQWVEIYNAPSGLTNLSLVVNGQRFQVAGLKDGETRTLDVGAALQPSGNSVTIEPRGKPGGSAVVFIHD